MSHQYDMTQLFAIPMENTKLSLEVYDKIYLFEIFGIPINVTIVSTWIVMSVLVLMSWLATRRLKPSVKVSKFQTLIEMVVSWLNSEVKEASGDNPKKYMGMGLALFMFVLLSNLLTIIPWFRPPTASLTTSIAMAIIVFLAIPYFAIRNAGLKGYLKKFIDPSPYMLPMNIFSEFASSFAMGLRLFGNMLSGVMFGSVLTSFLPFLVPLSMQVLGLLSGSIQAYIFALLAVVYTSGVVPEPEVLDKTLTIRKEK